MAGLFIGFLVKKYNASLVKADNPISDGIVFVFHLAGCLNMIPWNTNDNTIDIFSSFSK